MIIEESMGEALERKIREQLQSMAEKEYKEFSSALIPESKPLLGVRLPDLRKLAIALVKHEDWKKQLKTENIYFEEQMLEGMLIGYGTGREGNFQEAFDLLDDFVPCVDNWSVCDSFCVSFTIIEQNREKGWEHIQKYLYSEKEFEVRVGLVLLLTHFLKFDMNGKKQSKRRIIAVDDLEYQETVKNDVIKEFYIQPILQVLNREFHQGYYAQMAAAWLTAECFVMFPKETWEFLKKNEMDSFTFNKALQKICESRTPDKETKEQIKQLKRKQKKKES